METHMNSDNNSISRLLVLGTVICISVLLLSGNFTEQYVPADTASETTDVKDGDREVSCDPFGYYNGKWNLWEFIGDSVSSLFQ